MVDHAPGPNRRRMTFAVGALCAAACAAFATRAVRAATGEATPGADAASAVPAARPAPPLPMRALDELGIDVMMLRLDASDFLIDLRYRVNDVAKAQPLLEQKLRPVLVNEATGDRFYVPQPPKVGPLRQSATAKQPAIAGRVYFMLFANPDRRLKAGEKVTLYAGDTIVKDLVVR